MAICVGCFAHRRVNALDMLCARGTTRRLWVITGSQLMSSSQCMDAMSHFDLTVARQLGAASELAYSSPDIVERVVLSEWNCDRFRYWDVEATQCYVAASASEIIVCFRGTEMDALEDWIVDLDFSLVDGPLAGRVHEGFYDALSCVWHSLDREIQQLQDDCQRPLWVTGHSMGASLAALAAARWLASKLPVTGVYTFGQPRTGDRRFARSFDFHFRPHAFRLVNRMDIVTRTPPRSLGYRHMGTFIYLEEAGTLSHDVSWWQRFLDGWQGSIESLLEWGGGGVEDHRMACYRQRMAQSLESQRKSGIGSASVGHRTDAPTVPMVRPRRRAA